MSITALSLESTRPYVSNLDKAKGTADEAKSATIFQIGTLDSQTQGRIRDLATSIIVDPSKLDDEVETTINNNEVAFQTVSYGLKGWKNFRDSKKNDVEFKTVQRRHSGAVYDVVDPDCLKLVPQAIILELAAEISKDNEVSPTEGNA